MTARKLHMTTPESHCGCESKTTSVCEAFGYSKCPQTFEPIMQKSRRRLCFDFSQENCEDCCDLFYQHIRFSPIKKANPPGCPETEGFIRLSEQDMNPETGMFCFSVDAFDSRLAFGERFLITAWARLPNTEEKRIQAYISVHG